jgi:hypothetical protein
LAAISGFAPSATAWRDVHRDYLNIWRLDGLDGLVGDVIGVVSPRGLTGVPHQRHETECHRILRFKSKPRCVKGK